jgi:hypothetical protein
MAGVSFEESIRNEVVTAATGIRIKLRGLAFEDEAAAARLSAEVFEILGEKLDSRSSNDHIKNIQSHSTRNEDRPVSSDIDESIYDFLAAADIPMSVEQIEQFLTATLDNYNVKRSTLAVRLHRLAGQQNSQIINPTRAHYWINEFERAKRRKSGFS